MLAGTTITMHLLQLNTLLVVALLLGKWLD
jgi:hypothetical protein